MVDEVKDGRHRSPRSCPGSPAIALARPARRAGRPSPDARLEQGFERSLVPVALVDLDGRFLRVNAALCAFLGRDEAEVVGRSILAFTHPDDVVVTNDATRQLSIGDRQHVQVEKRYVRPDGGVVWGLAAATLIDVDGDEPLPLRADPGHQRPQGCRAAAGGAAGGARRPRARRTAVATGADAGHGLRAGRARGGAPAAGRRRRRHPLRGRRLRVRARDPRRSPAAAPFPRARRYELDEPQRRGAWCRHGPCGADTTATTPADPASAACSPATARHGRRAPILVDGRLWGAIAMATGAPGPAARRRCRSRLSAVRRARGRRRRQRERARGPAGPRLDRPADRPAQPRRLPRARRREVVARRSAGRPREPRAARRRPLQGDQRRATATRSATACCARRAAGGRERREPATCWRASAATSSRWLLPDAAPEEAWAAAERARQAVRAAELRRPRRRADVSAGICAHGAGRGAGRAVPARRRRPLLGQVPRPQHDGLLPPRGRRGALGRRARPPPGALAGPGDDPRAGPRGRRARPEHAAPLRARRRPGRAARGGAGLVAGARPRSCATPGLVHDVGKIGVPTRSCSSPAA